MQGVEGSEAELRQEGATGMLGSKSCVLVLLFFSNMGLKPASTLPLPPICIGLYQMNLFDLM